MRGHLLLLFLAIPAAPLAAAPVCVENASSSPWYFIAHADGGAREGKALSPGERICSDGSGSMGTVAVFEAATDIEGCSRRVPVGSVEQLIDFTHVDLCRWDRSN